MQPWSNMTTSSFVSIEIWEKIYSQNTARDVKELK